MNKHIFFVLVLAVSACKVSNQLEREAETPINFIEITIEEWAKDSDTISGTIKNVAKYSSFGNIVINAQFFDKDRTKIGTERLVYFEIIEVGKTAKFKFSVHPPETTTEIGAVVSSAQIPTSR